ncbi:MAG: hypothetical protein L7F78_16685, partial [Syntrophales bacterium LBB04]|nr:hypothetical protein [Syntrophales bacterium LBB04]
MRLHRPWKIRNQKEAFWFGFELLKHNYAIHPLRPGIAGWLGTNPKTKAKEACGNLLHPGNDGRPLWMNGGLIPKWQGKMELQKFEVFALEGPVDTVRAD